MTAHPPLCGALAERLARVLQKLDRVRILAIGRRILSVRFVSLRRVCAGGRTSTVSSDPPTRPLD